MIYETSKIISSLLQCDIFHDIYFSCAETKYIAILLTPVCDLVIQEGRNKPKAKYLKFAAITDFMPILEKILSQLKITKKQREGDGYIDIETFSNLRLLLKHFYYGSIYPRYFYLPPLLGYYSHSVVDFQLLQIVKYSSELIEELKKSKIASIKSSWKESIPVKYSSYSTRIGFEDISDEIINSLFTDYKLEFNIN